MKYVVLFFAWCSLCNFAFADIDVVIYADQEGAPLSYVVDGESKGLYVDIVSEAAKLVEGYNVKIRPIPWKRGLYDLERGQSFALLPPYKMNNRNYIDYYSNPIFKENVVLFCHQDVVSALKLPYEFPKSFKQLSIGVMLGYTLGQKFEKAVKSKIFSVEYARNSKANIIKMIKKRIDCLATPEFNFYWELKNLEPEVSRDEIAKFNFSRVYTISTEEVYVGYSKTFKAPYKLDFIKKMNQAIEQLKLTGQVKIMSEKYQKY